MKSKPTSVLKFRPSGSNGAYYRPERDITFFFPQLHRKTAQYIEAEYWPRLTAMVCELMHTQDQEVGFNAVVAGHEAVYRYLEECCRDPNETPADVLRRIGWDEVPEPGRLGYLAIVGLLYLTKVQSGLRDEHQQGQLVDLDEVAVRVFGQWVGHFNQLDTPEAALKQLREQVKECRKLGSSYDDILAAVNLERLGG